MNAIPSSPINRAVVKKRRLLSPVWFVPIAAAFIAIYLGWQTLKDQGPEIIISFNSAEGLVAGQTQIKYKAVSLGTVESITIAKDFRHVIVKARMHNEAKDILTSQTRFWVVRPRINYGNISGFETLVSGSYIQCDPGVEPGEFETHFTGLEEPPGVRLNEPGTIFTLKADKLGALNIGSPLYFRDVNVGEVLHFDIGDGFEPIKISVFVREPFDKFVHKETRFWNTSGLSFNIGPTGLQVQLQSLQSLVAGGISFSTKSQWKATPPAAQETVFNVYNNRQEAEIADMGKSVAFVTYFEGSVKNIAPGSPVSIYGVPVGEVTGVNLVFDKDKLNIKVKVTFEIKPERSFLISSAEHYDPLDITAKMVAKGLRVQVDSGGIIPGQQGLSLEFVPEATAAKVAMEGNAILLPSISGGGIDSALDNIAEITRKINLIPFAQIGNNLNNSLEGFNQQSDLQRSAKRTLDQVDDAARSIRLLTDFLSVHPEALIRGRDNSRGKKP